MPAKNHRARDVRDAPLCAVFDARCPMPRHARQMMRSRASLMTMPRSNATRDKQIARDIDAIRSVALRSCRYEATLITARRYARAPCFSCFCRAAARTYIARADVILPRCRQITSAILRAQRYRYATADALIDVLLCFQMPLMSFDGDAIVTPGATLMIVATPVDAAADCDARPPTRHHEHFTIITSISPADDATAYFASHICRLMLFFHNDNVALRLPDVCFFGARPLMPPRVPRTLRTPLPRA